jgi:hypothetical protein
MIRRKAMELALLIADEHPGQSAEARVQLISDVLALLDQLERRLAASGQPPRSA